MSDELLTGAYDQLVTRELAEKIANLPAERVLREVLEVDDAPEVLSRHLKFLFRRVLSSLSEQDNLVQRIEMSNRIVQALAEITSNIVTKLDLIEISEEPVLWAISPENQDGDMRMESPSVRLSESALLVNGRNQPSIGHEINKELSSADGVDLLCSFVMNTGLNILERQMRSVMARGGRIRVLTTTYMGNTERKALDRLVSIGAEVRISYDGTTTRLHAKSWLLKRNSGATTGYIGSSNLSKAALTDGIEWNIRVSAREQEHIIRAIAATFEDYWNDPEFVPYDPSTDSERLDAALAQAGKGQGESLSLNFANIEVTPRPFQQEVLDDLDFQRSVKGVTRNLVVMATGTGKTVVAGLDFRRLQQTMQVETLLFVAHRKEILQQSLTTFRTIMRDGSFGELFVDGSRPTQWKQVFGSIQSLSQLPKEKLGESTFDMIIVDEFHHAAADSYAKLLNRFKPKYLLGLTATPERADGKSILSWFDETISAELRLWEAIDRQILSPFQYFGISDNTDLSAANISWTRGQGYDVGELTNLYTANDARVTLVLQQLSKYVSDIANMKGIGFCVSVLHAEYMAMKFSTAGIPSVAVTSNQTSEERSIALSNLRSGVIKVIFAVDIFNEGVDLPDINTILMLRPTESPTIFLQQLGRGLRKSDSKNCLIVLDFVGNQNREFRFDKKYGSLLRVGRRQLAQTIESDFPLLPIGCHIELDRVTKEQVLANIKQQLKLNRSLLLTEVKNTGKCGIAEFLEATGLTLQGFYQNGRSLLSLQQEVFGGTSLSELDHYLARAIPRLLHVNDLNRLDHYLALLESGPISPDDRLTMMFAYLVFNKDANPNNAILKISEIKDSGISSEVKDVLRLLKDIRTQNVIESTTTSTPLKVHATYTRAEIVAAFGLDFTGADVAGVRYAKVDQADIAFVTLNKTEKHFSASTMYADTALNSSLFQWETQSRTADSSEMGQRYINHEKYGSTFHLFVRDYKDDPETKSTMPYLYFGPANYLSHTGSRPMRILWRLQFELPASVLVRSKVIAS